MKKSLSKRKIKFRTVFILISAVLALLTYFSLADYSNKYKVNLIDTITLPDYQTIFYKDLNYDGYSEKILVGKTEEELYFVTVHNSNGNVRDQFNLLHETNNELIFFHDFNSDNYDELVVFSMSSDTFFVSVIDANSLEFIRKETPLFTKSSKVKTKFWDFDEAIVLFKDLDENNEVEMLISPLTGFSIYPRGLYAFNTENFDLKYSFPTTCVINEITFYDIDNDGKEEILAHGGTSGNTPVKEGYHDHINWLFTFNKKLELIRDPFTIGEFPSSFSIDIIHKNNDEYILLIFHNAKNIKPEESFFIMDLNLNIIQQKNLKGKTIYSYSYKKNENIKTNNFYVSFKSGEISKYNLDLEEITSVKTRGYPYRLIYYGDICEEEGVELVGVIEKKLTVFAADLEVLFEIPLESPFVKFTLRNTNETYPYISISTKEKNLLFNPSKNYLTNLSVPIFLLLVGVYYMIINLLHGTISSIVRVMEAYNYISDDINLAIIITDEQGRIKSYNKSILYNTPLDSNIHKNKSIFTVFNETIELKSILSEALKTEKEIIKDLAFSKNDFRFIGKVQILPLFTLFKIPHSFVIKIQNLTKEIESDRSAVWSRIAQKVAHDIKTPLSTIQLNLSALKSRIDEVKIEDKEPVNDDIDMIQAEVREISRLTKSFLKFSSLEKPSLQWIDPGELIAKSTEPFQNYFDERIRFESEIQKDLTAIWVDPNQMIQLMHVFIENSIDAIKSKGQIKISVELVDDLQHEGMQYVEFVITDNGKGISQAEKNKIFEPYFTLKKDGTGMGLTIAKKIVEDHGGSVDVKSKLNFGTTVIIKIPHNQPYNNG